MANKTKLETSENNMLCLTPAKPMSEENRKKASKALKVG